MVEADTGRGQRGKERLIELDDDALWAAIAAQCRIPHGDIEDVLRASPFQEAMLALTARDPGAYVVQRWFDIAPHVDPIRLRAACLAVWQANAILRTRFAHHPTFGILQVVVRDDLLFSTQDEVEDEDVSDIAGPMVGIVVVGHRLRLSLHHSVYDGWSLQLILDDIASAYEGQALKPRPRFDSFIRYLERQDTKETSKFWSSRLSGLPMTQFPTLPHVLYQPSCTGTIKRSIHVTRSSSTMVTTATIATAAWALTLSRFLSERDICFAFVMGGRSIPIPRPSQIIGPMLATVPLRVTIDPDCSITEFLQHVQLDLVDIIPHMHYGLQNIDSLSSGALTSLLAVNPQGYDITPSSILAPEYMEEVNPADFKTYPLHMSCTLEEGGLTAKMRFDPTILDAPQAAHVFQYFEACMSEMSEMSEKETSGTMKTVIHAASRLGSNQLACSGKRLQLVEECVHVLIEQKADSQPSATAVDSWDQALSYRELIAAANRLAHYLISLGVGPEVYCCFSFEKSAAALIAIIGIIIAGGVCSPIDVSLPSDRAKAIIDKCRAPFVVCSPERATFLTGLTDAQLISIDIERVMKLPFPTTRPHSSVHPRNAVYTIWTSGSTGEPKGCVWEHRALSSSALAHGVAMHRQTSAERVFQFSAFMWDMSVCDIVTTLLHGGCICVPQEVQRMNDAVGELNRMRCTSAIVTPSLARALDLREAQYLQTLILAGEDVGQDNIDRYRSHFRIVNGYGPSECCVVVSTADLTVNPHFKNGNVGYPLATSALWIVDPEDVSILLPPGAIGEILIECSSMGREYVGDPARTAAAFVSDLPWACTTLQTPERRFYRSGDMGRLNSDGSYSFLGRRDTQTKIRGQRLEIGEVEHCLNQDVNVRYAVAFVPNADIGVGDKLVAVVALKSTHGSRSQLEEPLTLLFQTDPLRHELESKALERNLLSKLPAFAVPSVWLLVSDIPLAGSGKINRRRTHRWASSVLNQIPELGVSSPASTQQAVAEASAAASAEGGSTTSLEDALQAALARTLQIPRRSVTLDQSFAQLRGDSIQAMKLVSLLRSEALLLTVADVFRSPTIREMALHMSPSVQTSTPSPFSLLHTNDAGRLINLLQEAAAQCSLELADIEDMYPATPVQETFWLAEIANPGTSTVRLVYRTADEVPFGQLRAAWKAVAKAHHILRTRLVHLSDQKTYQVVSRKVPAVSQVADWGEIESDSWQGEIAHENLCSLVQAGPYVVFRMHHACYDGFSLPLIADDLMRACCGDSLKRSPVFCDFIKVAMDPARRSPSEQFWRQTLLGARETQFPYVPGAALATCTIRSSVVFAPPDYTISAVVHAAWALLLSSCDGSDDVIFGSVLAGRDTPVDEIARIPGPTMATIPLRCIVDRSQPAQEFLHDVQQRLLDAMEHQHFGIPSIRHISPDAKAACDFHTWVNILPPNPASVSARWTLDPEKTDDALGNYAHYAMTLQVFQNSRGADFSLLYSPSLMSSQQADYLLQCYQEMFRKLSIAHDHFMVADVIPKSLLSLKWTQPEPPELVLDSTTYWRRYLSDCEPCLIPLGGDDYTHQGTLNSVESLSVAQLYTFCLDHDVTPNDVISAAWALLLASYTGEMSACFGYLEPSPGVLERMQVCRIDLDATEPFTALTHRIQKDRSSSLPFGNLPIASTLDRAAENAPLFNTVVAIRESNLLTPAGKVCMQIEQAGDSDIVAQCDTVPWDLFVDASCGKETLSLRLQHSQNVGPNFALRIMKTLASVLRTMISQPQACCNHPDLTSADDKSQILKWNRADAGPGHSESESVHSLIAAQARSRPDMPAVVAWDGSLTYNELDIISTNLAHHLVGIGIRKGDSVPYCIEKSVWTPVILVAIMKSGGAFTPLNPEDPIDRQMLLLKATEARGLFVSPNLRHLFLNVTIPIIVADPVFFNTLPVRDGAACDQLRPQSIAYALHTSGSTGVSKTVLVDHSTWLTCNLLLGSLLHYRPGMRVLQFATHVWDVSLSELITPLVHGGTTYIPSQQDRLYSLTAFINKHGIDWAYITPSVARTLVPSEVPSLEHLTLVGEPVRQDDIQQWQSHVQLRAVYGACETGAHTSVAEFKKGSRSSPRNIGRGVSGSHFYLVHPHDPQRLAPIGAIGEIVCASTYLATGYLNDEQKTAEAFLEGLAWIPDHSGNPKRRVFRTGDLARYNADGSMDYVARKGGFVKVRGQRIELGSLEEQVLQCPSVRHTACAVPGAGPLKGLLVCVAVLGDAHVSRETLKIIDSSLGGGRSSRIDEVRDHVADIAPAYARPDVWIVVEALPFNASHKVARKKIHEWLAESTLDALSCTDPSDSTAAPLQGSGVEQKLRRIWAEILDLPASQVLADRSFLGHGGDSISSVRVVSALRRAGFHVTATDILRGLTIATIAGEAERRTCGTTTLADPTSHLHASNADPESASENFRRSIDNPAVLPPDLRHFQDSGNIEAIHDCSPLQDGIITAQSSAPERYTLSMIFRLWRKGDYGMALTPVQVEGAWTRVVAQHQLLRTIFAESSSVTSLFSQVVLKSYAPKTTLLFATSQTEAESILRSSHLPVEDLQPPHHLAICGLHDSNTVLCRLDIGHACVDGLSLALLWRDVCMACDSKLPSRQLPTYGEYVADMRRNLDLPAASQYWRDQLQKSIPCNVSVSLPRAASVRRIEKFPVPFTAASLLHQFCRTTSLTAASIVRAAWAMVLSLCTGQECCCFGYVSSGRDHTTSDMREVVGPFLDILLCTATVSRCQSVRRLVWDLQASFVESFPHQFAAFTPFARGGRLFNTVVSVWPTALRTETSHGAVDYEVIQVDDPTEYDLALTAIFSSDPPRIWLAVDRSRFSASQAQRMAAMSGQMLDSIITADQSATIDSVLAVGQTRSRDI